jgi:hypothetical protein
LVIASNDPAEYSRCGTVLVLQGHNG